MSNIPDQLIEKQQNQENNSNFNLHCGILQVLQDQLNEDWGPDELSHHGEGNEK